MGRPGTCVPDKWTILLHLCPTHSQSLNLGLVTLQTLSGSVLWLALTHVENAQTTTLPRSVRRGSRFSALYWMAEKQSECLPHWMCFEHLTLHSAVFGSQIAGAILFLQHWKFYLNFALGVFRQFKRINDLTIGFVEFQLMLTSSILVLL